MKKILFAIIVIGILTASVVITPFLLNLKPVQKKKFKLKEIINPTVTIKYQGMGGGSGTCIFKEQIDKDTFELYFLTANHVVDFDMYRYGYYPICPNEDGNVPFFPLYPGLMRSDNIGNEMPELIVKGWIYDDNCKVKKTFSNKGVVYKTWNNIDTAVVKVIAKTHELITELSVVKIEKVKIFDELKPGHPIICSGCPYLLPPIVSKGHIGRKNFTNKEQLMAGLNRVCLVRVNIAGGASGGGIYNYNNIKLVGIVSLGWGRNAFICGMIPVYDIVPKLRKTYLGQKLGL